MFSDDASSDFDIWTKKTPRNVTKKPSTSKTPQRCEEAGALFSDEDSDFKPVKTTFRTPMNPIFKTPAKSRLIRGL